MIATTNLLKELFNQLEEPYTGEALFDCMNDLVFFIKNRRGEYVVVNQEMVLRCGRREKQELLGRNADEVYPPPLGQSYRAQDEAIIKTGQPLLNQLELQIYHTGVRGWCLTYKLPLHAPDKSVIGLVGISKDLQSPNETGEDFARLAKAVDQIQSHYGEPLKIPELAALAGFSTYQFDQRMRRVFQLTPGQFILKVRMDAAMRQLRGTMDPVAEIAMGCGYSDQSAFTRQFHLTVGLSPGEFRRATIPK
jgi:AraC-like DNA-binding protein